jgi:hypothetical protein
MILLLLATLMRVEAQSMVVAKPVSDDKGMIAFQITEILKVEGAWEPPLTVGELLYPQKRQKAHPIMRFGEAVVIALSQPNNRVQWQGLHVHNGCIPALQGKPLTEMVAEVEKQAKAEALAEKNSPAAQKAKEKAAAKEAEQFAVCPICHQRHIRIR